MNTVSLTEKMLVVEPKGFDKLWSFRRKLEIPLDHIRGATLDPGANQEFKGIRAPGLSLPGKWAGTFHKNGDRSFWNVSGPNGTIVVELADEHYARLVLTVEHPRSVVDSINGIVQTR